jgi:succinate-semialdehyde dehydrogenase/glutarate-semialdehyde dehydrogenase
LIAEETTRAYGVTIPSLTPNTTLFSPKEPVGLCGIITPWNFPVAMITRKIAHSSGGGLLSRYKATHAGRLKFKS